LLRFIAIVDVAFARGILHMLESSSEQPQTSPDAAMLLLQTGYLLPESIAL